MAEKTMYAKLKELPSGIVEHILEIYRCGYEKGFEDGKQAQYMFSQGEYKMPEDESK